MCCVEEMGGCVEFGFAVVCNVRVVRVPCSKLPRIPRVVPATSLQPLALFRRGAHTPRGRAVRRRAALGAALVVREHEIVAWRAAPVHGRGVGKVVGGGHKLQRQLVPLRRVVLCGVEQRRTARRVLPAVGTLGMQRQAVVFAHRVIDGGGSVHIGAYPVGRITCATRKVLLGGGQIKQRRTTTTVAVSEVGGDRDDGEDDEDGDDGRGGGAHLWVCVRGGTASCGFGLRFVLGIRQNANLNIFWGK